MEPGAILTANLRQSWSSARSLGGRRARLPLHRRGVWGRDCKAALIFVGVAVPGGPPPPPRAPWPHPLHLPAASPRADTARRCSRRRSVRPNSLEVQADADRSQTNTAPFLYRLVCGRAYLDGFVGVGAAACHQRRHRIHNRRQVHRAVAAPAVTAVTPALWATSVSLGITITGSGFTSGATVSILVGPRRRTWRSRVRRPLRPRRPPAAPARRTSW